MILLAGKQELLVLLGDVFGLLGKYPLFVNGWHGMEITQADCIFEFFLAGRFSRTLLGNEISCMFHLGMRNSNNFPSN